MTASPTRGLLYPTLPDYDVFAASRSKAPAETDGAPSTDEGASTTAGGSETPPPTMARANWTGSFPADD